MKEALFPTILAWLSERSTLAKMESNAVVEVKTANDVEGEGDDERLVLAGGGGGHVEVVSSFLRLGVLIMMLP